MATSRRSRLPRIAARGPRPALVRRCREDGFRDWSATDLLEAIRQGAAGLAGDRPRRRRPARHRVREPARVDDRRSRGADVGVVTVPIYPTLPAPQVRYILADSGARVAIVSDRVQAAKVQEVRHLLPALELVVIIDPGTPATPPIRRPVISAWARRSSPTPRCLARGRERWRPIHRSDRPSRPAAPRSAPNRSPRSSTPRARRASPRA